ncbi:MAG: WXG100 family type VII secretion target [Clostridiales bacterium]|nr:WXG100 family type VII secretion target [Clostridiales bacterium]
MAAIQLKVTPEQLRTEASHVDSEISQVNAVVTKIYNVKNTLLGCGYKAESAQKYGQRMDGFQNDFTNLSKLLQQYSEYLRSAAQRYENNEKDLVARAGKLEIGK